MTETSATTSVAMNGETTSRVGLLGVGLMGSAMAHRLLNEGIRVVAWDRDTGHLQALGQRGANVARSASDVVIGADVVITMLPTAEIVLSVVEPLLPQWPETTIWLQMSSVGAAESDQLARVASANGVILFDAPVSGSTHPAEEGKLTILASGPDSARTRVEPVLSALGSRVQWVGEAGMGSRLKLAANHWMITMVTALAETMHLCELMGLDQQQFIALLDGGPLGSSYSLDKLGEMDRHEYPAGFPVRLAVKDLKLVGEVASGAHVEAPLLDAVLARMSEISRSHGDDDLAAVYELSLDSDAETEESLRSDRAGEPMTGERRGSPLSRTYEIRLRGHLGETMLRAFPDLAAETLREDTLLRGALTDQSALHGVLAQIEALGLELLELRRLSPA